MHNMKNKIFCKDKFINLFLVLNTLCIILECFMITFRVLFFEFHLISLFINTYAFGLTSCNFYKNYENQ